MSDPLRATRAQGKIVERGERNCLTCGKPHNLRFESKDKQGPAAYRSWADPKDGHIYRPESWESIARRLMAAS